MCEIFYSIDSHVRHEIALNKNHDDTKTVNITLEIELEKMPATHNFNVFILSLLISYPNIGKFIYYSITKYVWVSMSGSMIKCSHPAE